MTDLDNLTEMQTLDPHGMMTLTTQFPKQCREAVELGKKWAAEAKINWKNVRNIVMTGMGGSAIGGDFLRCLVEVSGTVPIQVNRDYELPAYVNENTLVIAASYSGNTEETLAAYTSARERGAQIAVVTSGGKLASLAKENGVPVCTIPGGQPPRASTGYMFFPMVMLLLSGPLLSQTVAADVAETLKSLDGLAEQYGPGASSSDNPAKQLATVLHGKLPVIYGSQGFLGIVARRWHTQFNENAKQHGFDNVFPEQNHNEILAWELAATQASNWAIVFLRDRNEKTEVPRLAYRVEVTKQVIKDVPVHEEYTSGESLLARMFSLICLGDFTSIYLAYLNGIDPTSINGIDYLKSELAKL